MRYSINNEPEPILFECDGGIARTLQNAKNLLMCRMGEVPFDRFRGLDSSLFDLPLPVMRERLMPELDRLFLYEPDVEVVDASCALNDQGEVIITVVLDVNG